MEDPSETLLTEMLNSALDDAAEVEQAKHTGYPQPTPNAPIETKEEEAKSDKETHSQWALGGNGRYMPVGATAPKLPAGIYEPFANPGMWGLELVSMASDGIYTLPDMATETVMSEARKFWSSEAKYRKHNLLYKRGLLLFGPPGSGKTVAVKLLMNELIKQDGIVVLVSNINLSVMCMKAIRRIEPRRNLIIVLEDIDEIIAYNGESVVLSLLDGENNVDNIFQVATTNYADKLGARIINRPSRFDRKVYVGMPSAEARKVYFEKATDSGLSQEDLAKWVSDTEDMSIAHLRELVAAVYCLDQPYESVISRLIEMAKRIKIVDEGFKDSSVGFGGPLKARAATGR